MVNKKEDNLRNQRIAYNTLSSLTLQLVTIICGLILPRFILASYGSEVNGLVGSISQFLAFIGLLDLGVGAVVQSAYYKPLAQKDNIKISLIYKESKDFFRIVAAILLIYVIALCCFYPSAVKSDFDHWYIIKLIIAISISYFAQYYFAVKNQLLLNADQKLYIQANLHILTLILNTIISIILIICGYSIQVVKLASSLVFIIRPIVLAIYVRKHYAIDRECQDASFTLEQKWNGMAQHCATVVMDNTGVMVLSFLSDIKFVSVYSVYSMVALGVRQFITSTGNSFTAVLGELYAKNRKDDLNRYFDYFEWILNTVATIVFTATGILIVPFVLNYTRGIYDVNYSQIAFSIFLTCAHAFYCIRIPYNSMVNAAGHYKQTQNSALIEMSLNLLCSLVMVQLYGLVGVAIGSLVAIIYRSAYFIFYLKRNIIFRPLQKCIMQLIVDVIVVIVSLMLWYFLPEPVDPKNSYLNWIFYACYVLIIVFIISVVCNVIFYKNNVNRILSKIMNIYRG